MSVQSVPKMVNFKPPLVGPTSSIVLQLLSEFYYRDQKPFSNSFVCSFLRPVSNYSRFLDPDTLSTFVPPRFITTFTQLALKTLIFQ